MNPVKTLTALAILSLSAAHSAFALDALPVRITNGATSPVPVTGAVSVSGTPSVTVSNTVPVTGSVSVSNTVPVTGSVNVTNTVPVTGSVNVTNTVPVTGTVNVGSMPPVTVTTGHDASFFVVPYALNVTTTDHFGVTLSRPAILDAIATTCDASMVGTHFQVTTDFQPSSATAFDPPPAGTQLVVRDSLSGNYSSTPMSLNYPPYQWQTLLDYNPVATDDFRVSGLNLVVLSDVNVLGPAFNPSATYCWGYFLFRRL